MPEPKLDGSVASPARTSDAELCYHPAALAQLQHHRIHAALAELYSSQPVTHHGTVGTMAPELNRCGRTMLELHVVGSGSGADGTGSYTVRDGRCTELCNAIDPHLHALVARRRPRDDHLAMAPAEQPRQQ